MRHSTKKQNCRGKSYEEICGIWSALRTPDSYLQSPNQPPTRRDVIRTTVKGGCAIALLSSGACTFADVYGDLGYREIELDLNSDQYNPLQTVGGLVEVTEGLLVEGVPSPLSSLTQRTLPAMESALLVVELVVPLVVQYGWSFKISTF